MNITRGVLTSLIAVLALAHHLPAQSTDATLAAEQIAPAPVNLDLPPEQIIDPDEVLQEELAAEAVQRPEEVHAWLLDHEPERGPQEALAAVALLHPDAFRRAHPPTPDQIRAEVFAAHAILNPRFPVPSVP
jgi:hypothetical protein